MEGEARRFEVRNDRPMLLTCSMIRSWLEHRMYSTAPGTPRLWTPTLHRNGPFCCQNQRPHSAELFYLRALRQFVLEFFPSGDPLTTVLNGRSAQNSGAELRTKVM
jgi:hypothetical protein